MVNFTSTPDLVDHFFHHAFIADAGLHSFGGKEKFFGEIQTVFCFEDSTQIAANLDSTGQGKVLVVDGGGSLRMALTGDEVLGRGVSNGWEGVILNGCVRDLPNVRKLCVGVKALAAHPGKRIRRGEGVSGIPVNFKNVTFTPGDYVFCDETGIVVLPRDIALNSISELQI
ncbi:ribonuclease E activity regulator RraA [Pantoea sp. DY-17]|uniref:ribonuclease E activity regulator RraA n=1 Tax=Pantoea sp. DY-17 TaxID=2871490 RepID=UPI001C982BB0|nr:ribonuclease E activity regulator RraA [Pantoea sp. DY-17]MBY4954575.1 ribonuclease E activity regulator RraA [Pantoea sp. DY-17]